MAIDQQTVKAKRFRDLHFESELLILPNVWDVSSAKLVESVGFPAIATASASMAYANGYDDGEFMPFPTFLRIVRMIANSTELPVTVDFERGYSDSLDELENNVGELISAGAIGLNIEDTLDNSSALRSIDEQCEIISTIRKSAIAADVPIYINARTDLFIEMKDGKERLQESIDRGKAYISAGADGFYPILCSKEELAVISSDVDAPINVFLSPNMQPISMLKSFGASRLSTGPKLFYAALSQMKHCLEELSEGNAGALLDPTNLASRDVQRILEVG